MTTHRPRLPGFAGALPAWIWLVVFFLAPASVIAFYSLGYKPELGSSATIGLDRLSLDRYGEVLSPAFRTVFVNTLQIGVLGTLACLIVGFPVAYFLARHVHSSAAKAILIGLVILPFWTSFLLRTLAWRLILARNGTVADWLAAVGLIDDTGLQVLDTRVAVQIGVVYNYLPLMILPLFVALSRVDRATSEAGRDLGATRLRTLIQVTLPQARAGIIAGILLVFIPLTGDYVTASLLGGARATMVGSLVANQFLEAQNYALGSAQSIVLILGILSVIAAGGIGLLLATRFARLFRPLDALGRLLARAPRFGPAPRSFVLRRRSRRAGTARNRRHPVTTAWAALVLVFLYAPIAVVVIYSFNGGDALLSWEGFSTRWYSEAYYSPDLYAVVKTTLVVAAISAMVAAVLGALAGLALGRRAGRWSPAFIATLLLVLVTPEIVSGIALLIFFVNSQGLLGNGLLRLIIGHSVFSTAVVTLVVRARFADTDGRLEEAGADLGAPPLRVLRQITMPTLVPALISGALLAFIFSLDDVIISSFVSTVGDTTLPVYVFSSLKSGLRGDLAAVTATGMLLTLAGLVAAALVLRRSGDSLHKITRTLTGG